MARLSIGDYVDTVMNGVSYMTQNTLNNVVSLGVFSKRMGPVVEIGPGTARDVAVSFFTSKGFTLAGSFIVPMPPRTTELLVVKRVG
jgi:hypothetical protein